MPYPSQFTREQLIQTARSLFEEHGYDEVSMAQVAGALGIKASSLYKHVTDKAALLREVNTLTLTDLSITLQAAVHAESTLYDQCLAMGRAYWDFAMAHPGIYQLAFVRPYHATPDAEFNTRITLPLQTLFDQAIGDDALVALRGAWALLHGFVTLTLGDHFRRGGSLDYERAWIAYLAGWGITP